MGCLAVLTPNHFLFEKYISRKRTYNIDSCCYFLTEVHFFSGFSQNSLFIFTDIYEKKLVTEHFCVANSTAQYCS